MKISLSATLFTCVAALAAAQPPKPAPISLADLLKASPASDWRSLDPENTLYMEIPAGRVVIELAPVYAPANVAAVRALVRERYFDGSFITRSQDNYVVQWGDPEEDEAKAKSFWLSSFHEVPVDTCGRCAYSRRGPKWTKVESCGAPRTHFNQN